MRVNFFRYQPEVEAERVAAVREALGRDMALAIDAVQNYNPRPWSVKEAARMLRMLEPFNLAWAEEMLPPFDPQPYAELRRATSTPISGGEGITTAAQFEQWLRAGAFDLAQPDATIIGGIGEARRACEAAAARSIPVAVHVWGSAPTLAANIHLAFATPNCIWVEHPVLGNPLESELFVEPLVHSRRPCAAADGPGTRHPPDGRASREVSVRAGQRQRLRRVGAPRSERIKVGLSALSG